MQLAGICRIVLEKFKRMELQQSLPGFAGIELSHAAGRQISRMGIRVFEIAVDLLEVRP